MKKALKVLKAGKLKIGENEIPCFVLDDEKRTRAISGRGMTKAIGIKGRGQGMARIFVQKNIIPFISDDLRLALETPFPAIGTTSRKATPTVLYEGTVLHDLCEAILLARDAGVLKAEWEKRYAIFAEAAIRSFSKVGIIALIDEATGYQYERERDELQKILKAYISEELLPWAERFPTEFYKEMFKLWGWKFPPTSDKGAPRGPRYAGKLTRKLIFEQLPPGVLEELDKLNPPNAKWQRKHRFSQLLTADIGNPHLEKQVAIVTTLMKISPNKRTFERHFSRAFLSGPQQEEFEFMKELDEQ